jgi:hypothetical protein
MPTNKSQNKSQTKVIPKRNSKINSKRVTNNGNKVNKSNDSEKELFIGNYNWLKDLKNVYGPVSLHILDINFQNGKDQVNMNLLLMGDFHSPGTSIKESKSTLLLRNFVLKLLKTNSKCFDLFIETYSPHIDKNINLKPYFPLSKGISKSVNSQYKYSKNILEKKPKNIKSPKYLSVGTFAGSVEKDKNTYDNPLESLRETPLLLNCRFHSLYSQKTKKYYKCQFPNLRYHSWDLRFTKSDSHLTLLSEVIMTLDTQLYDFFRSNGISGEELTLFLMFRPLNQKLTTKIKKMFQEIYTRIKRDIENGENVPNTIRDTFATTNPNADYDFTNFDKQKKLVNKQFNKVPKNLREKLISNFVKIYNKNDNYPLALTDFYTICRMLSKFNKKNIPNRNKVSCHSPTHLYCENILYYAGAQHTELLLYVLLLTFGGSSLKISTGFENRATSKMINYGKFKTKNNMKGYNNLHKANNFFDVMKIFYLKK